MSVLKNFPEVKDLLRVLRSKKITPTEEVLDSLYDILSQYAPPQRCKTFLSRQLGADLAVEFCSECGKLRMKHEMTTIWSVDRVCATCINTSYTLQEGRWYHIQDVPNRPGSNSDYHITGLEEYDHSVELPKLATPQQRNKVDRQGYDNLPYLGIEVEAEGRTNCPGSKIVDMVYAAFDTAQPHFVECKHDGSLNHGLEIVTAPATYDIHKSGIWESFFQENDGPAKFLRAWRTDTCGMHIHVSRASFTPIHLAKFILFINASENGKFMENVAGREGSRWARRSKKKATDILEQTDKYEAVNFSHSGPTAEVRIFRGNVSKNGIYRNIEFVQSLWEFTKDTSMKVLGYKSFLTWLQQTSNRKRFPYFYNWCISNDYIRDKPVRTAPSDTTRGV